VELPGIEPAAKGFVTCGNAELTTRNDAKRREMTCRYAERVDAINTLQHGPKGLNAVNSPISLAFAVPPSAS
jgi:hypothetical protein